MRGILAWTVAAVVTLTMAGSAHEITYSGTVVALDTAKYAQPGGGFREVQELEITILDAKTKKPVRRVFTITERTRVLRGPKPIALADAAVRKGDRIEVVSDHDKPGDEAIEIRLAPAR
jgi:hypothetical protein